MLSVSTMLSTVDVQLECLKQAWRPEPLLGSSMSTQPQFPETGNISDRLRSGRPHVTNGDQDRHIVLQHLRDRRRNARETARETRGLHQDRISDQTVQNRLQAANLRCRRPYRGPILTNGRRQRRLQRVNQHRGFAFLF